MLTLTASKKDQFKTFHPLEQDHIAKPFDSEGELVRMDNLIKKERTSSIASQQVFEIKTTSKSTPTLDGNSVQLIGDTQEREWLDRLERLIYAHLDDFNYTTEDLAVDLKISKRHLLRQLKYTVGQTPIRYIKTIRLNKAKELIENESYFTIKEIAYAVGYKDVAYFSKQFKKEYGKLPSEYWR